MLRAQSASILDAGVTLEQERDVEARMHPLPLPVGPHGARQGWSRAPGTFPEEPSLERRSARPGGRRRGRANHWRTGWPG